MKMYWLALTLTSDATFGRGDGVAGWVDMDIQHDRHGFPYLAGRTLRGLLVEECANILYGLEHHPRIQISAWQEAAQRLFGAPGSTYANQSLLRVSNACLPEDLRQAIAIQIDRRELTPAQVLASLTSIRRQTSIDSETGAAADKTLRSMRVVLRRTPFEARLTFLQDPQGMDLPLLLACSRALRRAGDGRNRGRGELIAQLLDDQRSEVPFAIFRDLMEVQ